MKSYSESGQDLAIVFRYFYVCPENNIPVFSAAFSDISNVKISHTKNELQTKYFMQVCGIFKISGLP